jgi:hypothetical protein
VPRVEASVVVSLDVGRTFALSQTYGELRYRWDPFVREQRLLDGATAAGKGVRTWTRSRHRLVMVSEYVSYRPPTQVGMRMVNGPWFFKSFSGGWNFVAHGDGTTTATWRYNFTVRPRWLAPLANRLGLWLLGRDIHRRLDAFATACADPTIVTAVGTPAPAAPGDAGEPTDPEPTKRDAG